MTDFRVQDGQVYVASEDTWSLCPAQQFWEWSQTHDFPKGIRSALGVARPILIAANEDSRIVVQVGLRTEIGLKVAPDSVTRSWDHCVVDECWIPIRNTELQDLFNCLESANVQIRVELRKAQFFQILNSTSHEQVELLTVGDLVPLLSASPEASNLHLLRGTPYEYQKSGIDWLCDYFDNNMGALLCDEMGLGKTYQMLGLIAHVAHNDGTRILICCPATLTANWLNEIQRFIPKINFYIHTGNLRDLDSGAMRRRRFVITTYELLVRDFALFDSTTWSAVICDEAQALKNRRSQRRNAVKRLDSQSKFMITGTPIENSLTDLWSLSDIVYEGLLGDADYFETLNEDTPEEARKLGQRMSPLILRRTVENVAKDLPPIIEIDEPLFPSQIFSETYEAVRGGISSDDRQRNFLVVLNKLTQLCCYPGIIVEGYVDDADTKFSRLSEILDELSEMDDDKLLIFTTFTRSLDLLSTFITNRYGNDVAVTLDGRVPPSLRQQLVDEYNLSKGFRVMIVNPKAGGAGLNITGANHVLHFNRQWNPQVERQATARAYRRKQEKTVFVHKFYYLGTVEEVINERLLKKEFLAGAALESALSEEEEMLQAKAMLISPLRTK